MGAFRPTYRFTVAPEQCDELGHLNVQHYIQFMYLGGMELTAAIGLSRDAIAQRRLGLAAVRMECDFLRELRAGEAVLVESAVESVGGKSLTFQHRLQLAGTAEEAMRAVVTGLLLDLRTRKAVPIPDDIRAAAEALAAASG